MITLEDVQRATRLWFVNSLRGWVRIALGDGPSMRPNEPEVV